MTVRPPKLGVSRVNGAKSLADLRGVSGKAAPRSRVSAHKRGYSRRWQKARLTVLMAEPLCRASMKLEGLVRGAEVLDHLYPHRGLSWLFWTRALWVPMTKAWHDGPKQAIEARGEAAINELAGKLGLPTLAQLEPDRVHEWRRATG